MLCKLRVNKGKKDSNKKKKGKTQRENVCGRKTTYYLCMSFHTLLRRFFMTGAAMFMATLQLYLQLYLWDINTDTRSQIVGNFN